MTTFILSFVKEMLMTMKSKLYIINKDTSASIIKSIAILIGEVTTALVMNIPITRSLIIKAFGVAFAVLISSLLASSLFNKLSKDKTYKFKIRFFNQGDCIKSYQLLKDKDIAIHQAKDKKGLTVFSDTKEESSVVIETIESRYKNYHIEELVYNERNSDN